MRSSGLTLSYEDSPLPSPSVPLSSQQETTTAGATSESTKLKMAGIGGLTVLGTALVVMIGAERIADKTGQTAERIALLSKAGSAEEAELLKKTEKVAHAVALGSANGASDALKTRWWPSLSLLSFLWGGDSKKDPAKKK